MAWFASKKVEGSFYLAFHVAVSSFAPIYL